jgi:hypothetical protein
VEERFLALVRECEAALRPQDDGQGDKGDKTDSDKDEDDDDDEGQDEDEGDQEQAEGGDNTLTFTVVQPTGRSIQVVIPIASTIHGLFFLVAARCGVPVHEVRLYKGDDDLSERKGAWLLEVLDNGDVLTLLLRIAGGAASKVKKGDLKRDKKKKTKKESETDPSTDEQEEKVKETDETRLEVLDAKLYKITNQPVPPELAPLQQYISDLKTTFETKEGFQGFLEALPKASVAKALGEASTCINRTRVPKVARCLFPDKMVEAVDTMKMMTTACDDLMQCPSPPSFLFSVLLFSLFGVVAHSCNSHCTHLQ